MAGYIGSIGKIARSREELKDLGWQVLDCYKEGESTAMYRAMSPEGVRRNIGWRWDPPDPDDEGWYDFGPTEDA
jgi:hypothetical protein